MTIDLSTDAPKTEHQLRQSCQGVAPLDGKLHPWMVKTLSTDASIVEQAMDAYGSPLNLVNPMPMVDNIAELKEVADLHHLDFRVYFARKANKCLSFVDAATAADSGVDVASEPECLQTLNRGIDPARMICTAAIKSRSLVDLCVRRGVTIAVDNGDELRRTAASATENKVKARIALRMSGFHHRGAKLHSRFGFDIDDAANLCCALQEEQLRRCISIDGIHFHLDGYCAEQRVSAIEQSLSLIDALRDSGHCPQFLDIGGGLPMSYLDSQQQWDSFWSAHGDALMGAAEPITYRNHPLGRVVVHDEIHGSPNVYPYFQTPVRAAWLNCLLNSPVEGESTLSRSIQRRELELRCEPGRSVLDGCGMTAARVEFTKQSHGGWFIGLAMNRTQCRTSSDDFMVDPLVMSSASSPIASRLEMEGYLVGAYCTESELLTLRKLRFPEGVAEGDVVLFPNTAGYLMHFLESRSHQFPLAKNLVVSTSPWRLDDIEGQS